MPSGQYFPQGDPVGPTDVVDRAAFLEELVDRLDDGQRLLLAGPRRTGKTSLAAEALRRLRAMGHHTAYVDLFGTESRGQFAEQLADALLENRSGLRRTLEQVRRTVAGVGRVEVEFEGLDVALALARGRDEDLFTAALDLPQQIAEADGRRVVVVFDEFQDLAKLGGDAAFKMLRAHLQHHALVAYLFRGSRAGAMRERFGDGKQAFYRFATPLDIPPIPEAAWVDYLARKFQGRGLDASPAVLRHLLHGTGGHPADTMMVCAEVLRVAEGRRATAIGIEDVEIGQERTLHQLGFAYDEIWAGLLERPLVQTLAARLARGAPPYGAGEHPQRVTRALDTLLRDGVVERMGRGDYRFTEPMFAKYIRRRTGG